MIKEILTNTGPKILTDLKNKNSNSIKIAQTSVFHSFEI